VTPILQTREIWGEADHHSRPLHPEDLVNIDLTLFYNGYHGDTSATFLLPDVDRPGQNLTDATKEALELGIRACGPGRKLSGIGKVIECVACYRYVCPGYGQPQDADV
jgi:methionine aminopeptidase